MAAMVIRPAATSQGFKITQCDTHHHKSAAPNHCDEGNAKPVDHSGRCHARAFIGAKEKGPGQLHRAPKVYCEP